jgi:hypothetical protein
MKLRSTGILAVGLLCAAACLAQQTSPSTGNDATAPSRQLNPSQSTATQPAASAQTASAGPRIAPGSVIPVQLTKTVDAKKAKTGDQVEAKVTQDVKTENGAVIVPKDTKVVGHVTEAQARSKEQKESQVGIAFDHAVLKNGGDMPLPMSIQAVIGSNNSGSSNSNNAASSENANQSPSVPSGGMPGNGNTRAGGMGTGNPAENPNSSNRNNLPDSQSGTNQGRPGTQQPITGETRGVVGIADLQLSTEPTADKGSVLTSEKNNVKLESGTLMLLRVNQ